MAQFIRSADRKFIINVSRIHRIYKVVNTMFLNIPVGVIISGRESGIYCDISGKSTKPVAIPLLRLSEIKRSVSVRHSRIRSAHFIKALSSTDNVTRLIELLSDQVERCLSIHGIVIDMSAVTEMVIARHWDEIVPGYLRIKYEEDVTQCDAANCL